MMIIDKAGLFYLAVFSPALFVVNFVKKYYDQFK